MKPTTLMKAALTFVLSFGIFGANAQAAPTTQPPAKKPAKLIESNVQQLTFHGVNGEGYFSPKGDEIIFQSYGRKEHAHTQIYIVNVKTKKETRISRHNGDDTCSYFHPTNPNLVLFASTYQEVKESRKFRSYDPEVVAAKQRAAAARAATQPAKKKWTMNRRKRRYKWMYKPYEVYVFDRKGKMQKRLTHAPGYDAEGTYSTDGKHVIFSSRRDGDQELYLMNADGTNQRRLTWRRGNDGGAFISPNGKHVTWRSFDHRGNAQVMVADLVKGELKNIRQLTFGKGIHWAPFWHPSNKWILFSSNHQTTYKTRRNFDLFLINVKGTCVKQLTSHIAADVLPVFSNDGKTIGFTSKRNGGKSQIYTMPFVMPKGCKDPRKEYKKSRLLSFKRPKKRKHPSHSYRSYRHHHSKGNGHRSYKHSKHHHKGGKHGKGHSYHRYGHRYGKQSKRKKMRGSRLLKSPLMQDLAFLASPFLEGRDAGTNGIKIASQYIANRFNAIGLKPGGENNTFYQYLTTALGVKMDSGNSLEVIVGNQSTNWQSQQDFVPFGFSASGTISGDVVFAGYGITAEALNYDDYKGLDVKGKIVLLLRYTPFWRKKGKHPWKHRRDLYAAFRYKILNARSHGAKGVLIVNLPPAKGQKPRSLVTPSLSRGMSDAGIPSLHIQGQVADAILRSNNTTLRTLWNKIEATKKPASVALDAQAKITVKLKKTTAKIRNVIGVLPGKHPTLKKEVIVVGAHYDHLGYGHVGAFPGNKGKIHPGADDNASGTAAMMHIARKLAKMGTQRTFVFIGFSGEERGLLGSAHYVRHPNVPHKNIVTMLNLDMVGQMKENRLVVQGSATSPIFGSILREVNRQKTQLALKLGPSGYGPSDHTSFYARKIPVLFFFTGAHSLYHRPGDTFDTLNLPGVAAITKYVTWVAKTLDQQPKRPEYRKVMTPRPRRKIRGGMRAYLGTIPDYGSKVEGVKLTGVRSGGPADKAGIKGGDIIIKMGRYPIRNLYDMVFALRDYAPGEKLKIVVKRKGKDVTLNATLGTRQSRSR